MKDFDIFIRFKDCTKCETTNEMADLLEVSQTYISHIKSGRSKLSEKVAHKMWKIAGDDISQMWGKLREQEVKKPRE